MNEVYKDYEIYKYKLYIAEEHYDSILRRKEELFRATQPGAVKTDGEHVNGGMFKDTFAEYVIRMEREQIDSRLQEARNILEDRMKLLEVKRIELIASSSLYDKVYVMRFIKNQNVKQIARNINRSPAQTYRIINRIKNIAKE